MVYTAEHPALAILEALVHFDLTIALISDGYVLLPIDIPDAFVKVGSDEVPGDMSAIGDRWIASGESLALRVPSVVAPHSNNVLLNPAHSDMNAVRSGPAIPWSPDPRLLGTRLP